MQVNIVATGKGGVGKSVAASMLMQYYRERGANPIGVDTDPVNATLSAYESLGIERLEIQRGSDIDPRQFDLLIERILGEEDPNRVMVVDNGAATFVPLCSYLMSNQVFPFLAEAGHEIRIHALIGGGGSLDDTLNGFQTLCQAFPDLPLVVWLNAHIGAIEQNGVPFEKLPIYKTYAKRIAAEIVLPALKKETFGHDMEAMLAAKITFDEVMASPDFSIMAKQRLKMIRKGIFEQLERAGL
jgi:hypothetical protein